MNGLLDKMKQFISTRGLGEAFAEFVKSLEPKTMKERLTEKQKVVKEQTQQKSMHIQEHGTSRNTISVPNCNSWKERLFMNITYEKIKII